MTADQRFSAALRAVGSAIHDLAAPCMIIGGVAVIAAGVPRQTIDIDATVSGRDSDPADVLVTLARHAIVPRIPDALQFARERQVLLLEHEPSGVTIELSFAWLPFEEEALRNAGTLVLEDMQIPVAAPEDLIVYKAAAWRDRDRSDIERLLVLHHERVDLERIRGLVAEIGAALDDPQRLQAFDEILSRVRQST